MRRVVVGLLASALASLLIASSVTAAELTISSFKINNGAGWTTNRVVTLPNVCTGATHYMASDSAVFSGATWQAYASVPTFTLADGDGLRRVYFKAKTETGEESPILSDTIVLVSGLSISAVGNNQNGQLGDGSSVPAEHYTAVQASLRDAVAIDGGYQHSIGLKGDGTVWAWGGNNYGQLGDGTILGRLTPVQVSGLTDVVAIDNGGHYNLALKGDGTVWAWGINYSGQLGDGTTSDRSTPVQVTGPGHEACLSGVVAVAAGDSHGLALKSDGTLWAWGGNSYGQLGDGTIANRTAPVQVKDPSGLGFLTGVVAVAGGDVYSLALKNDGTLRAWGRNTYGQLGDGTNTISWLPVSVKDPTGPFDFTGVVAIAAGGNHGLALRSDGTVWAWGSNSYGQLGDGTMAHRAVPVQVKDPSGLGFLTGVVAVAAGYNHSLSISDGMVWAWGWNYCGQLGDGTMIDRNTPVGMRNSTGRFLTEAVAVGSGAVHSFALKADRDGDGVTDASDACPGTVAGAAVDSVGCPAIIFGDFNRDGDVDGYDLATFRSCTSGPDVPHNGTQACQSADLHLDGDVDMDDFGFFQRCYSGALAAVPTCAN